MTSAEPMNLALADGTLVEGYAVGEGVGLLYCGRTLVQALAERAGQRAFQVKRTVQAQGLPTVVETELEVCVL